MASKKPGRFCYHSPRRWYAGFWGSLGWPFFSDDEYGRKVVVIGTWATGYLQWSYRTCWCEDCVELRLYSELCDNYGESFANEVLHRRIRLRELQRRQTSEL